MYMLSKKQDEILSILQEECAEVIQAISKVKRFGTTNNIESLAVEIGDMLYLTDLAKVNLKELNDFDYNEHRSKKFFKLREFSSIFDDTNFSKCQQSEKN